MSAEQRQDTRDEAKITIKHIRDSQQNYEATVLEISARTCVAVNNGGMNKEICFKSSRDVNVKLSENRVNEVEDIIKIYNNVVLDAKDMRSNFVKHRQELLQELIRRGIVMEEKIL